MHVPFALANYHGFVVFHLALQMVQLVLNL